MTLERGDQMPDEKNEKTKLDGMTTKDFFSVIKDAEALKQKIQQGKATPEEVTRYNEYYAPLVSEFKQMMKPLGKQLSIIADGMLKLGTNIAEEANKAVEASIQLFKSGKYYTVIETAREFTLIVDGKAVETYDKPFISEPLTDQERQQKQQAELTYIQEVIAKSKKIKNREFLLPALYEEFIQPRRTPKHETVPSSALLTVWKNVEAHGLDIPQSKDTRTSIIRNKVTGEIIIRYEGKDTSAEIFIDDEDYLISKNGKDISTRKMLLFLLTKANQQNFDDVITFNLEELIERGIYTNKRAAYKGVDRALDKLMKRKIKGVTRHGRKEVSIDKEIIFTGTKITFNTCTVRCNGYVLQYLSRYYMKRPTWIYELKRNAFILADYIYDQARQKQNQIKIAKEGTFNISLKQIAKILGCPDLKETRRKKQLIFEPILNSIMEVEGEKDINRIGITRHFNFDAEGDEVLEGYIEVTLHQEETDYILDRNKDREDSRRRPRRTKKALNDKPKE